MRIESRAPDEGPDEFVRFNLSQRLEHLVLMTSFIVLVATGVPQKFFDAGWAQTVILTMGGIETTRLVHRASAITFCLVGVSHTVSVALTVLQGRFVPSMIPGLKDVRDALTNFKYCLGQTSGRPRFDRYDYRQKFEYWGVVMGWIIMVFTGLILVFPTQATQLLPGAFVPAAKEMHGGEALLVLLIVVTWHLYGAHLNPLRFPGDVSIFTGKISRWRMIEEHPLEYARIMGTPLEEETVEEEVDRTDEVGMLARQPTMVVQKLQPPTA